MDDGTDTIYGVTSGHYGEVQTIVKGTISDSESDSGGDDFVMLSHQFPQRWRDIHVFAYDGTKRLLGTVENGKIYYTDDMGRNWIESVGLPSSLQNTIINKQDNNKIYTSDKQKVYISNDGGASFSVLKDFGTEQTQRLYTPRYATQPGSETVYLARDGKILTLSGSDFTAVGSFYSNSSVIEDEASFTMNGDERYLYVYFYVPSSIDSEKKNFMVSTDNGKSWIRRHPRGAYYNDPSGTASAFSFFGVNPEDPSIAILGYAHPTISLNGGQTDIISSSGWSAYQQGHSSWDRQIDRLRNNYHPDFQGSQFFYDKNGEVFSVRSSDGGLLLSRNEWEEGHYPGDYYNFTLLSPMANTETYNNAMVCGFQGATDFALGTQDQGWQNPLDWGGMTGTDQVKVQSVGGDGGKISSGPDGEYSWYLNSSDLRGPYPLYENGTFKGNTNRVGTKFEIKIKGHWNDLKEYSNTIWILNEELVKVTNTGTSSSNSYTTSTKSFGNSGNVAALCQSPSNKNLFWALDNNKVYKSTDGGSNFSLVATVSMEASTSGGDVRGWAFDDNTVLFAGDVTYGSTSVISTDGGVTFSEVPGLPDTDLYWMQGDKDGGVAMASTKVGPYLFDLNQMKWFDATGDYDNGAPYFHGKWGAYDPSRNVFRFSTWGYGVWDFQIDDGTPKLDITSPAGGHSYAVGDTLSITWSANFTNAVTIELLDSLDEIIQVIVSETVNDGEMIYVLDPDVGFDGIYRVQVSSIVSGIVVKTVSSSFIVEPPYSIYEAEDADVSGATISSSSSGYTGTGFVDYQSSSDDYIEWSVPTAHNGEYRLSIRYAYGSAPSENRPLSITVNGSEVEPELDFTGTGSWSTWSYSSSIALDLSSGTNLIRATSIGSSGANLDHMKVSMLSVDENVSAAMSVTQLVPSLGVQVINQQLRLSLSQEGSVRIEMYSLNGQQLLQKEGQFSAGHSVVDLRGYGLAPQVAIVKVHTSEKQLTQRISLY